MHKIAMVSLMMSCSTGSSMASPSTSDAPTGSTAPASTPSKSAAAALRFDAIRLPVGNIREVVASTSVTKNGVSHDVTWHPLLREGQRVGGTEFGLLTDRHGNQLAKPHCGHGDFGGLLQAHGEVWHTAHMECRPGAVWVSKLAVDDAGALSPVSTSSVDMAPVGGGSNFCAGMITPWNTLLSTEEYEPDGRQDGGKHFKRDLPAWYVGAPMRPYDFGWVPEIRVDDAKGATSVDKHYAMGRFSHEVALVMPDRRTVYLSDDGTNVGLFVFVADKVDDLSAGVLYAAKWTQRSEGAADLDWISLGHATDEQVAEVLRSNSSLFSRLFRAHEPPCRPGYAAVHTQNGPECLQPVPGVSDAVRARLETRRESARRGATTELLKGEGLVYDPARNVVYFAMARIGRGMNAQDAKWDTHTGDHVRVPQNRCGGVYGLTIGGNAVDASGDRIHSEFIARSTAPVWLGTPKSEGCAPDSLAGPDNIAFIPEADLLLVAEDTGYHDNNLLWAVDVQALTTDPKHAAVPIMAVPPGAEVTGIQWFGDVGGRAYLTATMQHPWQGTANGAARPLEERMGVFGYFGPFPK